MESDAKKYSAAIRAFRDEEFVIALELFRHLAAKGFSKAQVKLGDMHREGWVDEYDEFRQDSEEAARWYRLAAEQGSREAQHRLAIMYFEGNGVPQNKVVSLMFYLLLAETSGTVGMNSHWQSELDQTRSVMSDDEIAKAIHLARDWVCKHGLGP